MARHAKRRAEADDERLAHEIRSLLNNGTWRDDPWFLREPGGLMSWNGQGIYSRAQLERAADALAAVYTPEACREIFANPGRGPFVGILFMLANREMIFPFIRLGLDLADIGAAGVVLFDRLRDGAEFEGARLEAELWSALASTGAVVAHGPDMHPSATESRPDFRILWDYREYFLEVKRLSIGDGDLAGAELTSDFEIAAALRVGNATGLRIRFSEVLARLPLTQHGRTTIRSQRTAIVRRLLDLVAGLAHGTVGAGEHDVLGLGSVFLERTAGNFVLSIDGFQDAPPEKESERVLRLIRDGARQLPPRGRGVVFVDAPNSVDLDDLERLLGARSSVTGPTFADGHFAVVRSACRPTEARLLPFNGVAMTRGDLRLGRVLVSGRG